MDNYLKNYSRKKILDFTVSILTLCFIAVYVVQPSHKSTTSNSDTIISDTIFCDTCKTHLPKGKEYYDNTISSLYTKNDSLKTLLNACIKNSLKTFLKGSYYYHEITGKSDSININRIGIDLLILKNIAKDYLYLKIVEPKNLTVEEIAYSSATHQDDLFWSDGRLPQEKYVTISVEKLKSLQTNVIIEFTKPSLSEIPPLGRLKLIAK